MDQLNKMVLNGDGQIFDDADHPTAVTVGSAVDPNSLADHSTTRCAEFDAPVVPITASFYIECALLATLLPHTPHRSPARAVPSVPCPEPIGPHCVLLDPLEGLVHNFPLPDGTTAPSCSHVVTKIRRLSAPGPSPPDALPFRRHSSHTDWEEESMRTKKMGARLPAGA